MIRQDGGSEGIVIGGVECEICLVTTKPSLRSAYVNGHLKVIWELFWKNTQHPQGSGFETKFCSHTRINKQV